MRILKLLIFIILIVPLIDSINVNCPNSLCGNSFFSIKYPFKLQGQQPQISCDYVSQSCTSQNDTILSLPFSGEFYVFHISYSTKSISLYDPQDCLPKRLMNLNLSSSPFAAILYQIYTFYNCPITEKLFSDGFRAIDCLSNYSSATVASSFMSSGEMMRLYSCSKIADVATPVAWFGQFDGPGIDSNLELTWDVPHCKDCEESDLQELDISPSQLSRCIALFTFLGILCFGRFIVARILANKTPANTTSDEVAMMPQTTTSAAIMPPHSAGGGAMACPDEHYLRTMTISRFLEGSFGPLEAHDQSSSCTICLDEYSPQDIIRCLTLCHHYFHAKCIDQWLHKNSSCPVCRTSILDVKL